MKPESNLSFVQSFGQKTHFCRRKNLLKKKFVITLANPAPARRSKKKSRMFYILVIERLICREKIGIKRKMEWGGGVLARIDGHVSR